MGNWSHAQFLFQLSLRIDLTDCCQRKFWRDLWEWPGQKHSEYWQYWPAETKWLQLRCATHSGSISLSCWVHRNSGNVTMLGNRTCCNEWRHWEWKAKGFGTSALCSSRASSFASISLFLFSKAEVKLDSRSSAGNVAAHNGEKPINANQYYVKILLWGQPVVTQVEAATPCELFCWDIIAHRPPLVLPCPSQLSLHNNK